MTAILFKNRVADATETTNRYIRDTFDGIISVEEMPFLPQGRIVTLADGKLLVYYDIEKDAVTVTMEDGSLILRATPHPSGWRIL